MSAYFIIGGIALATVLSLLFSTLTYSLRMFSRLALADFLGRHNGDQWFDSIVDHTSDLVFITAVGRQVSNILMWMCCFGLFEYTGPQMMAARYGLAVLLASAITILTSVALPHAAATYSASELVGLFAPFLHLLRLVFSPLAWTMHVVDKLVRRATGAKLAPQEQIIESEILSAVEEGEKEGVVDEQEREIIESVIEFRDTTTGQIMTPRPEIFAVEVRFPLKQIKETLEESGHSRVPVYEGSLDQIIGVLYARDLIKHLMLPPDQFDIRQVMRPAFFVPETKPLRDLLKDFRAQQVHIAIVLDEYGGTSGLVTIEDILEELVGEINDEHEPDEPAMLRRVDDRTAEADARLPIDQINRLLGLSLPEDAGYDTLGGFLSTSLGHIPKAGTLYEHNGVHYTILSAEPQKVNRVRIEMKPQPAADVARLS